MMSFYPGNNTGLIIVALVCCCLVVEIPLLAQSTLKNEAQSSLDAQQHSTGVDAAERTLLEHPEDAAARKSVVDSASEQALLFRKRGQLDEALGALLRAKKIVPADATLLFDIGVLENQMHLNKDASEALEDTLRLRPQDPLTLYALARVRMDLGEYPEAEIAMRSYLSKRPEDVSAHYGLGRILVIGLKDDAALAEFQRSIQLQPGQTESYFEIAEIDLRAGNLEEAEAGYKTCLLRDPKHGGALTGMGIVAYRRKQFAAAGGYLDQAVQAAPAYQTAHYYRGLVLAKLGRKQEADEELATAATLAAEDDQKKREQLKLAPP